MEIENLFLQRKALDAQILDVKTAGLREELAELEQNRKFLANKLDLAKKARTMNDGETQRLVAEKSAEIAELKKIYFSDCYFISQIENGIKENGSLIGEKQRELEKALSDS
jgi:DNA-directed RNA polymerase alpha subunit